VPPGGSLIGTPDPGETRYYGDFDEHGPRIHWLPPAWPDDEGPAATDGGANE
jgi:hypothetical protein